MLCPDTDMISDFYRLRNDYNNRDDKISISFEIALCHNETERPCERNNEILTNLFSNLLVSLHFFKEQADFNNYVRPITS